MSDEEEGEFEQFEHDLVKALQEVEGPDLEELELKDGAVDEDEERTTEKKKKKKKTAKKPAAAKKSAAATDSSPPPPSLPPPGSSPSFETDLSSVRRWIAETIGELERALDSTDSVAEVRTKRVMAEYAKALRSAAVTLTKIGGRYEEMHRVMIAYCYDARQRETFADRRGAGAFQTFAK